MRSSSSLIILISFLLGLVTLPAPCRSARILAIYPCFLRSHLTVAEDVLEQLAAADHEVTLISAFRFANHRDNMDKKREIHLAGLEKYMKEEVNSEMFTKHSSAIEDVPNFIYAAAEMVNYTMTDPGVQDLLQSDAEFDLIIMDHFLNDAFLGFGFLYKSPVVLTSSTVMNKWIERTIGNPNNPAYIPHLFLGYTSQMSFWQRMINVVVSICEDFSYDLIYLPVQESMYQRFFAKHAKNEPLPPLLDLIQNVSLALVNSNSVFHGSRALMPNVVEIGGVHVKRPTKPLPKDVNHYFSIADDGIFIFTLGANTKPSDILSKEKLHAFNYVFRRIPGAGIFIKWDDRDMEGQSDNVVIGQWIPQTDMMAHEKVRLLITNGGLLSIYEAIYFKKPIIGIPLFGDQFQNMALVEQHRIGRVLNFDNITQASVKEIVDDVRLNPVYQENIDRLHELMFNVDPEKDKLAQAVAQIEYVIRTNGAGHLKAPALALSVWQLYLVDVTVTLILIVFLILAVPAVIIGTILRRTNARIIKYDEQQQQQQQMSSSLLMLTTPRSVRDEPQRDDVNSGGGGGKCSAAAETTGGDSSTTLKKHN